MRLHHASVFLLTGRVGRTLCGRSGPVQSNDGMLLARPLPRLVTYSQPSPAPAPSCCCVCCCLCRRLCSAQSCLKQSCEQNAAVDLGSCSSRHLGHCRRAGAEHLRHTTGHSSALSHSTQLEVT